jgi:quercetin dioxygenase-like cupin family protein
MNSQPDRLRQHPEQRFGPSQHRIDLGAAAARILAEPMPADRKHRQQTLYRYGPVTVALFLLDRGAGMPQHVAEGVVTVHVLEGRITITAEDQVHALSAGQLLVLAPGVEHDVRADEASRMLLTVCLEGDKKADDASN